MQDIRKVSMAVFAASFLIGFLIFEADKSHDNGAKTEWQLSMTPLFSSDNIVK